MSHMVTNVARGHTCHMRSHLSHVVTLVTCGHLSHVVTLNQCPYELSEPAGRTPTTDGTFAPVDLTAYAEGKNGVFKERLTLPGSIPLVLDPKGATKISLGTRSSKPRKRRNILRNINAMSLLI